MKSDSTKSGLRLVWNQDDLKVDINGVVVQPSHHAFSPFPVSALVEEQDTCLLLGAPGQPLEQESRPNWYVSRQAAEQRPRQPGEVIIRPGRPVRLLAVVYDVDREPNCHVAWITAALHNIFTIASENQWSALAIPVLGSGYGRITLTEFMPILVRRLREQSCGELENPSSRYRTVLQRVWLMTPSPRQAFELLRPH